MSCPRCGHTVIVEDHRKHYACAKCDKIVTENAEPQDLPTQLRELASNIRKGKDNIAPATVRERETRIRIEMLLSVLEWDAKEAVKIAAELEKETGV